MSVKDKSIKEKAQWILDCRTANVSIVCASKDSKAMLEAHVLNSLFVAQALLDAIEVIEELKKATYSVNAEVLANNFLEKINE